MIEILPDNICLTDILPAVDDTAAAVGTAAVFADSNATVAVAISAKVALIVARAADTAATVATAAVFTDSNATVAVAISVAVAMIVAAVASTVVAVVAAAYAAVYRSFGIRTFVRMPVKQ
jgi:hypothetical protein